MSGGEKDSTGSPLPRELTAEQAREKRAYHLALYRKYTEADGRADSDEVDPADSTMATLILPGD